VKRRFTVLRRLLEAVAIAVVVAVLAGFGLANGQLSGFQDRAVDQFFPSAKRDPAVIVVGMDDKAIAEPGFGYPPWPRDKHAQIARQLTAAGAAVIVWDVLFLAPDTSNSERPRQLEETADLANALETASESGVTTILGVAGELSRRRDSEFRRLEPVYPFEDLGRAASGLAHVKVETADGDGVVRAVPLVVETTDGALMPSLSLAAVLAYRGAQPQVVAGPKGVQAGGRLVPTEQDTELRLNFARGLDATSDSPAVVSSVDVYNGTVNPNRFKDKIVFIGATAESMNDNFDTPVNKSEGTPGVLIHANAVNTMLTASYLDVNSDRTTVLWVALLALLVAIAVLFLPLWVSIVVSVALAIGYVLLTAVQFDNGHIMNLIYPFVAIVLAFLVALMVRYFTETRHRQRVSKLFAQYVPETVAQQLVEQGRVEQAAEGERLDVSLFFCDLRGFTAMSANLTPQQVRIMLNEFYDALTEIILEHKGTVLKFVGDEVFAVFGAPLPVDHHPQVTLDCAMAIQRAAPELSARLADMDIPEVHFGIGMNSGEVVAAHVGGGRRRQYDIVGDTVNIGSRMCGQAGKGDIVMPIDCYRLLDDPPPAESMGFVALKNVERPMELMRIRVDEPVEPAERDEQDEPSAQETARDEVPVAAPADDATMRA
jgi:adenylate cyclase